MGRRLAGTVVLRSPETGEPVALLAGGDVPDWAAEAITNPDLWEDVVDPDEDDGESNEDAPAGDPDEPAEADGDDALDQDVAPDAEQAEPAEAAPVKRSASRSSK